MNDKVIGLVGCGDLGTGVWELRERGVAIGCVWSRDPQTALDAGVPADVILEDLGDIDEMKRRGVNTIVEVAVPQVTEDHLLRWLENFPDVMLLSYSRFYKDAFRASVEEAGRQHDTALWLPHCAHPCADRLADGQGGFTSATLTMCKTAGIVDKLPEKWRDRARALEPGAPPEEFFYDTAQVFCETLPEFGNTTALTVITTGLDWNVAMTRLLLAKTLDESWIEVEAAGEFNVRGRSGTPMAEGATSSTLSRRATQRSVMNLCSGKGGYRFC